jgi:hypothetical protein
MKSPENFACLLLLLSTFGTVPIVAAQQPGASPAGQAGLPVAAKTEGQAEHNTARQKDKTGVQPEKPVQPQRKPSPRRHVWQVVGPEPLVNLGPVYSPTLTPRQPATPMPAPIPGTSPVQPGPAPLNSCAGSLCADTAGSQYNIGTGNAGTDSQGRLCNRVGTTVQCF